LKLSSFNYLVKQGFDNVWKNRVMAFASFCVLLVSLLLVGISVLFSINIHAIIGSIEDKNEAVVYLEDYASEARVREIGETLKKIENVSSVTFVSRDEALMNLETDTEYPEIFQSLGEDNPLPDSYRIKVADISKMSETTSSAESIPDVMYVRSPDTFVELLTEIRRIFTIVAIAIITAMLIVSMVIISNTTRASVFSRRREISIMQSVGATKAFIRFPFFIEGMINGFVAGAFAMMLTWFTYDSLVELLGKFEGLSSMGFGNVIPYNRIALQVAIAYIVAGSLIGAFGSVLSTRVHLKYRAANM